MNTYEFITDWVVKRAPTGRVLDYGCGAGQIVGLLRERGVDAWGCDVFYEGGDYSEQIPVGLERYISRMDANIPFADGSFDIVVSNQVMEHVADLDGALAEIARVLKPGGVALNVFPHHGVWHEGHCGIPFLHWFSKRSKLRFYYALVLRTFGMGNFTRGKTRVGWTRDFCNWLDKWTFYRSKSQLLSHFRRGIGETAIEDEKWLTARFQGRLDYLPLWLRRFIVTKMAGIVLVSCRS
jgi:SAM-dependent methyltransferase